MAKEADKQPQSLKVQASTVIGSMYAQIVGVSITDFDATLEFVYINPQIKTEGQTVARITMPRPSLEELGKLITNTIKQHEEKKSK